MIMTPFSALAIIALAIGLIVVYSNISDATFFSFRDGGNHLEGTERRMGDYTQTVSVGQIGGSNFSSLLSVLKEGSTILNSFGPLRQLYDTLFMWKYTCWVIYQRLEFKSSRRLRSYWDIALGWMSIMNIKFKYFTRNYQNISHFDWTGAEVIRNLNFGCSIYYFKNFFDAECKLNATMIIPVDQYNISNGTNRSIHQSSNHFSWLFVPVNDIIKSNINCHKLVCKIQKTMTRGFRGRHQIRLWAIVVIARIISWTKDTAFFTKIFLSQLKDSFIKQAYCRIFDPNSTVSNLRFYQTNACARLVTAWMYGEASWGPGISSAYFKDTMNYFSTFDVSSRRPLKWIKAALDIAVCWLRPTRPAHEPEMFMQQKSFGTTTPEMIDKISDNNSLNRGNDIGRISAWYPLQYLAALRHGEETDSKNAKVAAAGHSQSKSGMTSYSVGDNVTYFWLETALLSAIVGAATGSFFQLLFCCFQHHCSNRISISRSDGSVVCGEDGGADFRLQDVYSADSIGGNDSQFLASDTAALSYADTPGHVGLMHRPSTPATPSTRPRSGFTPSRWTPRCTPKAVDRLNSRLVLNGGDAEPMVTAAGEVRDLAHRGDPDPNAIRGRDADVLAASGLVGSSGAGAAVLSSALPRRHSIAGPASLTPQPRVKRSVEDTRSRQQGYTHIGYFKGSANNSDRQQSDTPAASAQGDAVSIHSPAEQSLVERAASELLPEECSSRTHQTPMPHRSASQELKAGHSMCAVMSEGDIITGLPTTPQATLPAPTISFLAWSAEPVITPGSTETAAVPEAVPVTSLTPHSRLSVREMAVAVVVRTDAESHVQQSLSTRDSSSSSSSSTSVCFGEFDEAASSSSSTTGETLSALTYMDCDSGMSSSSNNSSSSNSGSNSNSNRGSKLFSRQNPDEFQEGKGSGGHAENGRSVFAILDEVEDKIGSHSVWSMVPDSPLPLSLRISPARYMGNICVESDERQDIPTDFLGLDEQMAGRRCTQSQAKNPRETTTPMCPFLSPTRSSTRPRSRGRAGTPLTGPHLAPGPLFSPTRWDESCTIHTSRPLYRSPHFGGLAAASERVIQYHGGNSLGLYERMPSDMDSNRDCDWGRIWGQSSAAKDACVHSEEAQGGTNLFAEIDASSPSKALLLESALSRVRARVAGGEGSAVEQTWQKSPAQTDTTLSAQQVETMSARLAFLQQEAVDASTEATEYRARLLQSEALCDRLSAELEHIPSLLARQEQQRAALAAECTRRGDRLLALSDQLQAAQKTRVQSEAALCAQLEVESRARVEAEARYAEAQRILGEALQQTRVTESELGFQNGKISSCSDLLSNSSSSSAGSCSDSTSPLIVAYLQRMLSEAKDSVAEMALQHDATFAQLADLRHDADLRSQQVAELRAEADMWSARSEQLSEEAQMQSRDFSLVINKIRAELTAAEAEKVRLAVQLLRSLEEKETAEMDKQALEHELSQTLEDKQMLHQELTRVLRESTVTATVAEVATKSGITYAVSGEVQLSLVMEEKEALETRLARALEEKQAYESEKHALEEKLTQVMEEKEAAEQRHESIRRELVGEVNALMDTVIASLEGPALVGAAAATSESLSLPSLA